MNATVFRVLAMAGLLVFLAGALACDEIEDDLIEVGLLQVHPVLSAQTVPTLGEDSIQEAVWTLPAASIQFPDIAHELAPGDDYPGPADKKGGVFKVSQRGGGLIERRVPGGSEIARSDGGDDSVLCKMGRKTRKGSSCPRTCAGNVSASSSKSAALKTMWIRRRFCMID